MARRSLDASVPAPADADGGSPCVFELVTQACSARPGSSSSAGKAGYGSAISSSGSVVDSIASCAASTEDSGTNTLSESESSSGWTSDSSPADERIDWSSSPSPRPPRLRPGPCASCRGAYFSMRHACAALAQLGTAAFLERELDQVEVPRHDRIGEDGPRLSLDLPGPVAAREMREREQGDAGVAGERAASSAVECSVSRARSASSSQNVASCTSRSAPRAAATTPSEGAVSPVSTTFRPGRGAPSTWSGLTTRAVGERHRLAPPAAPRAPALRDTERVGGGDVEAAGPLLLHERVADRDAPVEDRERAQLVAVARQDASPASSTAATSYSAAR